MTPRPDPRLARTRGRALDAAYALLLEHGFGQVTVDDVSARSGVSKSTLYRHWSTRDELLREAFSTHALTEARAGGSLEQGLLSYALAVADGLERAWGRAAASLAVASLDDPAQREVQQVFLRGMYADLHQVVAEAVDRGEQVRADGVDRVLERLLAALFYRYLFTQHRLDRRFVTTEVQHALADLWR